MSVLICSTTYGGCGYIGEGRTFHDGGIDWVICPQCYKDHSFQLTDMNFDSLVNDFNREQARKMLDEENASIHGGHLRFCVENGYIARENLTPEQRVELGISPTTLKGDIHNE